MITNNSSLQEASRRITVARKPPSSELDPLPDLWEHTLGSAWMHAPEQRILESNLGLLLENSPGSIPAEQAQDNPTVGRCSRQN